MTRLCSLFCCLCIASACTQAEESLTIAVASNFHGTAKEIAEDFSAYSGVAVRVSSGSTGSLYARIANGAPYDIFLAADVERPELLVTEDRAYGDSLVIYANGQLVVWSPDARYLGRDCLQDIRDGRFSRLAIANPDVAPYGAAARRFLRLHGLWTDENVVFGESVAQAFQFVASGNASIGLVAASHLVAADATNNCSVDISQYGPEAVIPQAGIILKSTSQLQTAREFMRFMQSTKVRAMLETRGYRLVEHPVAET